MPGPLRVRLAVSVQEQLLTAIGDERGAGAADRLCEASVALFGVDAAAISLVFGGANTGTLGVQCTARVWDELLFTDLADPSDARWPAYGPPMLAHEIRGVSALPVVVAGEYVGALGLLRTSPGPLGWWSGWRRKRSASSHLVRGDPSGWVRDAVRPGSSRSRKRSSSAAPS